MLDGKEAEAESDTC